MFGIVCFLFFRLLRTAITSLQWSLLSFVVLILVLVLVVLVLICVVVSFSSFSSGWCCSHGQTVDKKYFRPLHIFAILMVLMIFVVVVAVVVVAVAVALADTCLLDAEIATCDHLT